MHKIITLNFTCILCVCLWYQTFGFSGLTNSAFRARKTKLKMSDEDYANRPGPWDDRTLNTLLDANKAWASRMTTEKPDFFKELKKGHAPKILWIGCSDARVPANEIIGEPPGSVFVHRNVANMVVSTDFNCMSVIQYAVDVLKVKHIVVCGHYDCGGIRAALEQWDHKSPLENWLRNIRDTYRLHMDEINAQPDLKSRQRRLVELNVIEQCVNIFKTAVVQRRRVETHNLIGKENSNFHFSEPRVHAFVYEPTTGEAQKLPVNFNEYLKEFKGVYDLYSTSLQDLVTPTSPVAAGAAGGGAGVSVPNANEDLNDEEEIELQKLLDSYPSHSMQPPPAAASSK